MIIVNQLSCIGGDMRTQESVMSDRLGTKKIEERRERRWKGRGEEKEKRGRKGRRGEGRRREGKWGLGVGKDQLSRTCLDSVHFRPWPMAPKSS